MMEDMSKYPQIEPRPLIITIIMIISAAYTILGLLILLIPEFNQHVITVHGAHFPLIAFIINLAMLIAYYGIWKMKFWGVILYGISFLIDIFYTIFLGVEMWWMYIPGIVILAICLFYYRHLS